MLPVKLFTTTDAWVWSEQAAESHLTLLLSSAGGGAVENRCGSGFKNTAYPGLTLHQAFQAYVRTVGESHLQSTLNKLPAAGETVPMVERGGLHLGAATGAEAALQCLTCQG
jgi:hypothetical protein